MYRGGGRGREVTCVHGLSRRSVEKISEGKSSYELSWRVKVMIKRILQTYPGVYPGMLPTQTGYPRVFTLIYPPLDH